VFSDFPRGNVRVRRFLPGGLEGTVAPHSCHGFELCRSGPPGFAAKSNEAICLAHGQELRVRPLSAEHALKLGFGHPIGAIGGFLKPSPVGDGDHTPVGPYEPVPDQEAERHGHARSPHPEH
jgi:hypothetical protein